jgi:hypothetical protein
LTYDVTENSQHPVVVGFYQRSIRWAGFMLTTEQRQRAQSYISNGAPPGMATRVAKYPNRLKPEQPTLVKRNTARRLGSNYETTGSVILTS